MRYVSDLQKDITKLSFPLKIKKGKGSYLHLAPSLNEIIRLSKRIYSRGKRSAWADLKKEGEEFLFWNIKKQTHKQFTKPVGITYQRHAVKLLDPDSLGASFKLIGDALQKANVIVDDDPAHITFYPEQYKVDHYDEEVIIVKIWEL